MNPKIIIEVLADIAKSKRGLNQIKKIVSDLS